MLTAPVGRGCQYPTSVARSAATVCDPVPTSGTAKLSTIGGGRMALSPSMGQYPTSVTRSAATVVPPRADLPLGETW